MAKQFITGTTTTASTGTSTEGAYAKPSTGRRAAEGGK